jgi:ferritin-like protein
MKHLIEVAEERATDHWKLLADRIQQKIEELVAEKPRMDTVDGGKHEIDKY